MIKKFKIISKIFMKTLTYIKFKNINIPPNFNGEYTIIKSLLVFYFKDYFES
jgi:hypothetical protein